MINPMSLTALFQSVGLSYGPTLPLIILVLFIFLALPAVFRPSVRADSIALAAYCYLAQMLGILLMTAGGLPALYAVFAGQPLAEVTYLGLLLVFAAGGALFLWHDMRLNSIDPASRAIPAALFFITWKFMGLLVTVFAGLSFVLRLMLAAERTEDWWVMHLIMILYGLILAWFTLSRPEDAPVFTSLPTRTPAAPLPMVPRPAVTVKKPIAKVKAPVSKPKPKAKR